MDQDDDVEHLFSWLQTPELRYREFAGARELTDVVIAWQTRTKTAEAVAAETPEPGNAQLDEEYPADQFPDQVATAVAIEPEPSSEPPGRGRPAMIAPVPMPRSETPPAASAAGPFALGAAGRASPPPQPREWVEPRPPLIQSGVRRQPAPPVAPQPRPPRAGGLLGGAYRENADSGNGAHSGAAPPPGPSAEDRSPVEQSLDAVFGRLAGRARAPDPRDRLRHIPGLGPPSNRAR